MRHTPCGCRSAYLAIVQPNSRLPRHPSMRRAPAMPLFRTQSAAEKTSLAPHDSKARLRPVTTRRDSWRSHVHRLTLRSACSSSSPRPAMETFLSGDLKGDTLFCEREYPLYPRPHTVWGIGWQHFVLQFYSDKRILSLSSSCPAPALNRAMRSSTPIPARSLPATSSTMCPSAIISVRLPSSSA